MSEAFGVSVSAYYRWLQNPISKRQMRQNQIDALIRKVFEKHKSRYGCTRITEDLKDLVLNAAMFQSACKQWIDS